MKLINLYVAIVILLSMACTNTPTENTSNTSVEKTLSKEALTQNDSTDTTPKSTNITNVILKTNDTLNELSNFISGNLNCKYSVFKKYADNKSFNVFSKNFEKRWRNFDSTKLYPITNFVETEFLTQNNSKKVFYPFSGPDILYSSTLFPNATEFTLIGLEPVGTLPIIDDKSIEADSIQNYFNKINASLNAILKFSFFRTVSMKEDLRNNEVDGTIHLILLFLNKTQHQLISVKPFYIDTLGQKQYLTNTLVLNAKRYKNSSIEIMAIDKNNNPKTITYTSTDLSDGALRKNKGLNIYLNNLKFETTYLKGASYLMHKKPFSEIRNIILNNSNAIVQDDSGIAVNYIMSDKNKWQFKFYGEYTKPINMFTQHYQAELDSLYKKQGAKKLGFGLGYNYRDKNSNFMIINKTKG